MKIFFITREGYRLPGARIRCYNFAKELVKYGVDAQVLSFSDTLGAKDGENEGQLKLSDKISLNYKALRLLAEDRQAIFYIQRLNYHSFAPYIASLLKKNKIILDLDDWEMREDPRYLLGFYPTSKAHYLTGSIAKRSIFCVAASRFLEEFLLQFNKRVYYIPSGVDTALFTPSKNGPNGGKITFSWIGTLHRKEYIENIRFALDCFCALRKKYSHIYFEIAGDGIYNGVLVKIVNEIGDKNILLKGWIDPQDMPDYLAAVDIGLFPVSGDGKFNRAKSPTKLFEYMAMAKPTVVSDFAEARFIIRDNCNGLSADTKEEYAEKMQRLIEEPRLRKEMGEQARRSVEENYSLGLLGERLYNIIRQFQ